MDNIPELLLFSVALVTLLGVIDDFRCKRAIKKLLLHMEENNIKGYSFIKKEFDNIEYKRINGLNTKYINKNGFISWVDSTIKNINKLSITITKEIEDKLQ